MRTIIKFEFISHGLEHPDYFQGCGVTFTEYDEVFTGCGNTEAEAAEDALEQCICAGDFWPSELQEVRNVEIDGMCKVNIEVPPDGDECLYYVSMRVKYEKGDGQ